MDNKSSSPRHVFSRTISIPTRSDDYSDIDGFQVDVYEADSPIDETLRERLRF